MNRFLLFFMIMLSGYTVLPQGLTRTDSIRQKLRTAGRDERPLVLFELAGVYKNTDTSLNSRLIDSALHLALKLENKRIVIKLINDLSNISYKQQNSFLLPLACQALALARQHNYLPEKGESYTNIGNLYFNIGQCDSAISNYVKATKIFLELKDTVQYIEVSNNLIFSWQSTGNFDKALQLSEKLLAFCNLTGNKNLIANQLVTISQIFDQLNNWEQEKKYLAQAMLLFIRLNDEYNVANIYRYMGVLCQKENNLKAAMDYFNKAQLLYTKNNKQRDVSTVFSTKGDVYLSLKEYNNSISMYLKALEIVNKLNDNYARVYIMRRLGTTYSILKDYETALEYLNQSLEITISMNDNRSLGELYYLIANVYLNQGKIELSEKSIQKALQLSVSLKNFSQQKTALKFLSNLMYKTGKYRESVDYLRSYNHLNDSLNLLEIDRQMTEIQAKYESNKSENEILVLNLEKEKQKATIVKQRILGFTTVVILIFVGLLAVVLYRGTRKQKEANHLLTEKNAEINRQKEAIQSQMKDLEMANTEITAQRDQIERKSVELQQNNQLLEQQKVAIQEQNRELQVLNATKDKFFSIIAHDLKNPFNNILGFSDLLAEGIDQNEPQELAHYAGVIHKSAQSAFTLLENLLDWARSQTGNIKFEPEMISLENIIADVINMTASTSQSKGIQLDYEMKEPILVRADKNMISTILRNLVTNAIKYSFKGGSVKIIAIGTNREIRIEVHDKGIGIKPEETGKLFKINEKASTLGTNAETGTGLGLILCKEFVERHGGRIWVESQADAGSEFIFTIPVI
ncbi:MAG: tetratricopeptide repeat-containing sensor histidine kinase [Bacteroidetes bacterium]|nr:tetratricopeptide repeat-containing sensor histidine kinase [Bacteroidota bacterium]